MSGESTNGLVRTTYGAYGWPDAGVKRRAREEQDCLSGSLQGGGKRRLAQPFDNFSSVPPVVG